MKVLMSVIVAALLLAASYLLQSMPATAQVTYPYPVGTACNVTTTAAQCISQNPTRRTIQICNVTSTGAVVWIAPAPITPVANAGGSVPLAGIASNVASCFTPPNGLVGSTGAAWNAVTVSSPGTLTIYEW